jgi:hypothetical protein
MDERDTYKFFLLATVFHMDVGHCRIMGEDM